MLESRVLKEEIRDCLAEFLAGGNIGGEMDAGDDAVFADLEAAGQDGSFKIGGQLGENNRPEDAARRVKAGVGSARRESDDGMDIGILEGRTGAIPEFLGGRCNEMGVVRGLVEKGEGEGEFLRGEPRSRRRWRMRWAPGLPRTGRGRSRRECAIAGGPGRPGYRTGFQGNRERGDRIGSRRG